jgi:hypothetical protein
MISRSAVVENAESSRFATPSGALFGVVSGDAGGGVLDDGGSRLGPVDGAFDSPAGAGTGD